MERETRSNDPKVQDALAQVKTGFESLVDELSAGHTERFLNYLSFSARFHRYSPNNQMLIWLQRPDASAVAGYRKWQDLGYQVAKGEKGIGILAPVFVKTDELDDKGKPRQKLVGYKGVSVFDAAQLTEPVRELNLLHDIPDDADEQRHIVSRAIQESGIVVMEKQLRDGHFGAATFRQLDPHAAISPVIVIKEGLHSRQATSTLIHEWAHHLIHFDRVAGKIATEAREIPPSVKEAQVEAIAYIVSKYVGVEPPIAADYILMYKNTAQILVENMDIIQKTSAAMIGDIDQSMKE